MIKWLKSFKKPVTFKEEPKPKPKPITELKEEHYGYCLNCQSYHPKNQDCLKKR